MSLNKTCHTAVICNSYKKKSDSLTFLHFAMFCSFSPLFFLFLSLTFVTLGEAIVNVVGVCWKAVYSSTGTSSPLSVALVSPSLKQRTVHKQSERTLTSYSTTSFISKKCVLSNASKYLYAKFTNSCNSMKMNDMWEVGDQQAFAMPGKKKISH